MTIHVNDIGKLLYFKLTNSFDNKEVKRCLSKNRLYT